MRRHVAVLLWALVASVAGVAAQPIDPSPPVVKRPWRGVAPAPAGADTLDLQSILRARSAAIDSALLPSTRTLDTLGLDSLVTAIDRGGAAAVDSIVAARGRIRGRSGVGFSLLPGALSTYDRVNGLRLGSGIALRAGPDVELDAAIARAYSAAKWAGRTRVRVGGGRGFGTLGLGIEAGWSDHTVPFGPNQGAHWTSLGALTGGQDRQEYVQRRAWFAGAASRPGRRSRIGLRYFVHEDWIAPRATSFHFVGGGTPIERDNPAIDVGTTRGIEIDVGWRSRFERIALAVRGGMAGDELGGEFDYAWQEASVSFASPTWAEGVWKLDIGAARVTRSPPAQAVPYLGGDGNLRGYAPLEFAGDTRVTVRAEYAYGRDLLARTGIPGVRSLRLQFIPFVDAGTTWGAPERRLGALALDGRFKAGAGLGVQRNLDYPGLGALRLDVSWRTDGEAGGASGWLRVIPFMAQ